MANTNQQVVLKIIGDASQFVTALGRIEKGVASVGTIVNTVQTKLNSAVSQVITKLNTDLTKMESNLETTRKRVIDFNSQLQASNKEMKFLQQTSSSLNLEFVKTGISVNTTGTRFKNLNVLLKDANSALKPLSSIATANASSLVKLGAASTSAQIWLQKVATNARLASPNIKALGDASKTASLSITALNGQIQTSTTKFTLLNKALTAVRPALTGLKTSANDASAGIQKMLTEFETFSKSLTSLNAKLSTTNAGLRNTQKASNDTGKSANGMGAGFISAGTHIGGLYLRVTGLQLALSTLGHVMDSVARSGAGFLGGLIQQSADFERSVTTNITIMGDAANGMGEDLRKTILQLGKDTIFSSQQVADASLVLTKAGQDAGSQIQGVLKATAQVAAASQEDMSSVAATMTTALAVFKKGGGDAVDVGNQIVKTVNASKSDLNSYAEALTNAGSALSLMNVKQKDFDALVAFMSQRGFSGSATGTSILYFISRLVPTTQVAFNLMKQFGLITVNTSQIMKDFGTSIGDINAPAEDLLQRLYELNGGVGQLNDQSDADIAKFQQWAVSMGYLNSKFFDMKGNLKDMSTVGQILSDTFSKLPKDTQIQDLAKILGSRGGGGTKVAGSLVDAFSSGVNPINQWTDAINKSADAATVSNAIVQTLSGRIEYLKSTVETLRIAFGKVFEDEARKVLDFFSNLLNDLTQFLQDNPQIAQLAGTFITLSIAIAAITAPVALALALLPSFASALGDLALMSLPIAGILGTIGAAALGLKDALTSSTSTLGNVVSHVAQQLGALLPQALEAFSTTVHTIFEPAGQSIVNFIQNSLLPGIVKIATWLVDNLPAAIEAGATAWNSFLLPALASTWQFISTNIIPILGELAKWIGTNIPVFVDAAGKAWNTVLYPALKTVWDIIRVSVLPILVVLGSFLHTDMVPILQIAAALFVLWRIQIAATWVQQRLLSIWTAITSVAIQQNGEKTLIAALVQKTWNGLLILGTTIMKFFGVATTGTTIAINLASVATKGLGIAIEFVKTKLGPVAIAIGLITIVLGLLKAAWDNNFLGIRDLVQGVVQFVGDKLGWLVGIVKFLGDVVGTVFGFISGQADDMASGVQDSTNSAAQSLDDLAGHYTDLGQTILDNSPSADSISQPFAQAANNASTDGTNAANNFATSTTTTLNNAQPAIKTAMDALVQPLRDFAAKGGSGEQLGKAAADSIATATTAELRAKTPEVAKTVQELIATAGTTPGAGGFVTGANPEQKKLVDAWVGSLIVDLKTEEANKSKEIGDSGQSMLMSQLPTLQEAAKYIGGDIAVKFGDNYKAVTKTQLEEAYQLIASMLAEAPQQADIQNGLAALYNAFNPENYQQNPKFYAGMAGRDFIQGLVDEINAGGPNVVQATSDGLQAMNISPQLFTTGQLNSQAFQQGVVTELENMKGQIPATVQTNVIDPLNSNIPTFGVAGSQTAYAYTNAQVQALTESIPNVRAAVDSTTGQYQLSSQDVTALNMDGFQPAAAWSQGALDGVGIHDKDIQDKIQSQINGMFVPGAPLYAAGFTPANSWSKGMYDGAGNYYVAIKNVVDDTFILLRVQVNALNQARTNYVSAVRGSPSYPGTSSGVPAPAPQPIFSLPPTYGLGNIDPNSPAGLAQKGYLGYDDNGNPTRNPKLVYKNWDGSPGVAQYSGPSPTPGPVPGTPPSGGNAPAPAGGKGGGGGGGGGTTISPAQAAADTIKNVSDAIKSWGEAIKVLQQTNIPSDLQPKINAFVQFAAMLIQKIQAVAVLYKDAALTTISNFADAGAKVVDFLDKYVTLMQTLNKPDFTIGPVVDKITTLVAQARIMMNLVAGMLGGKNGWQPENIQMVGDFADAGGKVADFLIKYVSLMQLLNTPGFTIGPVVDKINTLIKQAHIMMNLLGTAISATKDGPGWTDADIATVGNFADNGGKVADFLIKFVTLTQTLNNPNFSIASVVDKVHTLVNEAVLMMDNIGSALTGKDGWTPENVTKVANFADAGGKVADSLIKLITLLADVANSTVNPQSLATSINNIAKALADVVTDVNNLVDINVWGGQSSPSTAIQGWSDTGGKAVDAIVKLLSLLESLTTSTVNPQDVAAQVSQLVKSLADTIQDVFNVVGNDSIWGGTSSPATAIQGWSDTGGKAIDALAKILSLLTTLSTSTVNPTELANRIGILVKSLGDVIIEVNNIVNTTVWGSTTGPATGIQNWSDSGAKIIDALTKLVTLITGLAGLKVPASSTITTLVSTLKDFITQFNSAFASLITDAGKDGGKGATSVSNVADSAGKVVESMDKTLTLMSNMLNNLDVFKKSPAQYTSNLINGMRTIVLSFQQAVKDGLTIDDASVIVATNIGTATEGLGKALTLLTNMTDFHDVSVGKIDSFFQGLKQVMNRLPDLLSGIADDTLTAANNFGTKMAPAIDTMDKALSFFVNLMGATSAKTSSKTGTTTTTEKSGFQGINPESVDEFIASLKYLIDKLKTGLLDTIAPEMLDLANAFGTKIGPAMDVLSKALDLFIKLVPDSEGKGGLKTIDPNAIGALVGDLYLLLHHWHNLIIGGEFQGDFAERSAAFADTLGIVLDAIQKAVDLVTSIQNVGGVDKVVGIFTQLANAMQQADNADLPKISKDFTTFFTPIFQEFQRQGIGTDSDTVLYNWGNKDNRKALLTHMWLDVEGKAGWRYVIGLAINGMFQDIHNYFTTWIPQLLDLWEKQFLNVMVQDVLNAVTTITDALSLNITITVTKTTATQNQSTGVKNPPAQISNDSFNGNSNNGYNSNNNNYYIRQVNVKQVSDMAKQDKKMRQLTRNLG